MKFYGPVLCSAILLHFISVEEQSHFSQLNNNATFRQNILFHSERKFYIVLQENDIYSEGEEILRLPFHSVREKLRDSNVYL